MVTLLTFDDIYRSHSLDSRVVNIDIRIIWSLGLFSTRISSNVSLLHTCPTDYRLLINSVDKNAGIRLACVVCVSSHLPNTYSVVIVLLRRPLTQVFVSVRRRYHEDTSSERLQFVASRPDCLVQSVDAHRLQCLRAN